MIICLWVLLAYLADNRLDGAYQAAKLYNLELFAVVGTESKKRKPWFAGLIDRLEANASRQRFADSKQAAAYTDAAVRALLPKSSCTVAVVSSRKDAAAEQMMQQLTACTDDTVTYIACPAVLEDAASMRTAAESDAVLLAEQSGVSILSEINREIIRLEKAEKEIVGLVLSSRQDRTDRFDLIQAKGESAMKIPFSPPDIGEEEIAQVVDTLRSGWITTGPKTKELERQVAQFCRTNRAVCLNSATAALELTWHQLGIGEGDEVITCAYTYTASASVACHVGAKLVLVDCQKDGYEMDYDALEGAITPRTKAIIPVDIGGVICNYDRIFEIVRRKQPLFTPSDNAIQRSLGRVAVVADAAHAFGASRHGKMCGEIADFTCFSFHVGQKLYHRRGWSGDMESTGRGG